jgi:multidrug efflux pump subunit AcrA (membrane-fusion protein)
MRSPVDGLVIKRLINAGGFCPAGNTLLVIGQDDTLWVNVNLSEWDYALLHQTGQRATFSLPADSRTLNTNVEVINPELDRDTATVKFRMPIPNPDHRLRPGMFVQVQLDDVPGPVATGVSHPPAEATSTQSVMERLNEVERTIDKLLEQKEDRSSSTRILERLNQIERKLNQLLDQKNKN